MPLPYLRILTASTPAIAILFTFNWTGISIIDQHTCCRPATTQNCCRTDLTFRPSVIRSDYQKNSSGQVQLSEEQQESGLIIRRPAGTRSDHQTNSGQVWPSDQQWPGLIIRRIAVARSDHQKTSSGQVWPSEDQQWPSVLSWSWGRWAARPHASIAAFPLPVAIITLSKSLTDIVYTSWTYFPGCQLFHQALCSVRVLLCLFSNTSYCDLRPWSSTKHRDIVVLAAITTVTLLLVVLCLFFSSSGCVLFRCRHWYYCQ